MTMDAVGEDFWGAKLVENGWRKLKDGAHRALTYFAPKQGDSDEGSTQRWGLLATDVVDHPDRLEVRMEVPGVELKDLTVSLSGRTLVVAGERFLESSSREGRMLVTERAYGGFRRSIPLPESVDRASIDARFKNGVLSLTLPKTAADGDHRITVEHD